MIWQFQLPAARLTGAWIPFMDRSSPDHTFRLEGNKLRPTRHCCPDSETILSRVMVSSNANARTRQKLGPWIDDNPMTQYQWVDGTPLVESSTAQLRSIQVHHAAQPHGALRKWTEELGRPIPDDVWQFTWMDFRSAAENTFLWQILYRILATQRWRFPERAREDPTI